MTGRITVRLSKSGQQFFKSKLYKIRINQNTIGDLNHERSSLSEILPIGKYTIEVVENDFAYKQEVVLANGQLQTFTINPGLTYSCTLGFLIGIAIGAIGIIGYMAYESKLFPQLLPLMIVPIIPLILFRKKECEESFCLTKSEISS